MGFGTGSGWSLVLIILVLPILAASGVSAAASIGSASTKEIIAATPISSEGSCCYLGGGGVLGVYHRTGIGRDGSDYSMLLRGESAVS